MMIMNVIVSCMVVLMCTMHSVNCIKCNLTTELVSEIRSYEKVVKLIEQFVVDENGPFRNQTWNKLANFVDDFGSRLSGTQNLENAIDFLKSEFINHGLDNVHGENVSVPHWIRNTEYAILKKPRGSMALSLLGLGGSIGTPETGINASVMVVRTFEELKQRSADVTGKIVVLNPDFVTYGKSVEYRTRGAIEASKFGAVAVLVGSIAPFSIGSPHTGQQNYEANVKPIPAACISKENAGMLDRLHKRGVPLQIHLFMGAQNLPMETSRNLIGEIEGKLSPEKVVLVSGHIDSWDVGQGAMDDGGGAFISWMSLVVLRRLNLRPKRTVRAVLWTAEEQGYYGSTGYLTAHKSELKNFTLMMESDVGTFSPIGLTFFGSSEASCIMEEILKLMIPFNATTLKISNKPVESDISIFQKYGVPGAGLQNENEKYFWYHHSNGDSMDVEDSGSLDRCTALFAATSFIVADLGIELPRAITHLSEDDLHP